jgi:hypothetical protein
MSSHSISELYEFTPETKVEGAGLNPLATQGSLDEAEFIDLRLSPQRSRVGIIFDVQWCYFQGSNVALVVLNGVGRISWSNDENRLHPWFSTRGYWKPETSKWSPPVAPENRQVWAQDADSSEKAAASTTLPVIDKLSEYVLKFDWLSVSGLTANIYLGHVDGLDGAPPDMSQSSDAEIIAGYPQWSSVMEVREHYVYPE